MSSGSTDPGRPRRRLRVPGRTGRVVTAVAIALLAALAGIGLAEYVDSGLGLTTLVVYTYPSLLGGADCDPAVYSTVFGAFASAHHIRFELECPAGTLVSTMLEQANSGGADLVIGLDELTTPEAEAHDLLVPYAPPELANVSPALAAELSPDDAAVPYEYGYLAIDYGSAFANATDGAVARATFPDFVNNTSWASQLLTESPLLDITGQEFLVWQILYYEEVLHQNWTGFWRGVRSALPNPAPDWGTAYGEFLDAPGQNQMVVSYSTDPAYAAEYGESGAFNSTLAWYGATAYAWRTIYGIGIVAGTRHLALDQEFENWFLSPAVQSEIPLNEWEYPAVNTTPLPSVFDAALNTSGAVILNDANGTTPAEIVADLPGWVNEWYDVEIGGG
jgi:thiamine transport system substrate-binding protein